MKKRPVSVTLIAWLYIVVGCGSLTGAVVKFADSSERDFAELRDLGFVCTSALLAVLGGAFLLRGHNWARWLCIAWMAAHIAIGALNGLVPVLVHSMFFALIAYILLRAPAAAYFRKSTRSA